MTVIEEIAAERQRQIDSEGWISEHDDEHWDGQLRDAAACYCLHDTSIARDRTIDTLWPWEDKNWKPTTRRRNLIKAAALVVAELERLDRLQSEGSDSPAVDASQPALTEDREP